MRHKLLAATTALLWLLNFGFVAAIQWWPDLGEFESVQRLLVGITLAVTFAWLLRRPGIEYRIGYRHGRKDQQTK